MNMQKHNTITSTKFIIELANQEYNGSVCGVEKEYEKVMFK